MNISVSAPARSLGERLPPHTFFLVSAVFHYLGPAFAVLLFSQIEPLGVAWLRIATAAFVFAPLTQPWLALRQASPRLRLQLIGLGVCLATGGPGVLQTSRPGRARQWLSFNADRIEVVFVDEIP